MNRTFWSKLVVIPSLQPTFKKTCCPGGWWVADFLKSINPDLATPVWSHLGRAKLKPLWPQEPRPWCETCSHIQMCHWKKLQSRTTQWWRLWWNLLHVHFVKKMIEHEHSNKIRFHHHQDMPCAVPHWTTTWRQTAWGMSLGPRQHICQPKLLPWSICWEPCALYSKSSTVTTTLISPWHLKRHTWMSTQGEPRPLRSWTSPAWWMTRRSGHPRYIWWWWHVWITWGPSTSWLVSTQHPRIGLPKRKVIF